MANPANPLPSTPEAEIRLLLPAEAAAMLGLVPETLENWRVTNRYPLRYIKIGSRVRYSRADVQDFIRSRRVGG